MIRLICSSISCVNLKEKGEQAGECDVRDEEETERRFYSTSAPASTNSLLGNFEESLLNGRIEPSGAVEGFVAEIGASGQFCPKHISLPVTAFFFNLSDDNAPSPYLVRYFKIACFNSFEIQYLNVLSVSTLLIDLSLPGSYQLGQNWQKRVSCT